MHAHCGALRTQMACPACPSGRASTSRSAAAAGWAAPSASTLLTRRVRRGPAPPLAAALAAAAATPWSRAEPNRVLAVAVDESDVSAFSREREREARSQSSLVLSCPLTLPPFTGRRPHLCLGARPPLPPGRHRAPPPCRPRPRPRFHAAVGCDWVHPAPARVGVCRPGGSGHSLSHRPPLPGGPVPRPRPGLHGPPHRRARVFHLQVFH